MLLVIGFQRHGGSAAGARASGRGRIGLRLPVEYLVLDEIPGPILHVADGGVDQLLHVVVEGDLVLVDSCGDRTTGEAGLVVSGKIGLQEAELKLRGA